MTLNVLHRVLGRSVGLVVANTGLLHHHLDVRLLPDEVLQWENGLLDIAFMTMHLDMPDYAYEVNHFCVSGAVGTERSFNMCTNSMHDISGSLGFACNVVLCASLHDGRMSGNASAVLCTTS